MSISQLYSLYFGQNSLYFDQYCPIFYTFLKKSRDFRGLGVHPPKARVPPIKPDPSNFTGFQRMKVHHHQSKVNPFAKRSSLRSKPFGELPWPHGPSASGSARLPRFHDFRGRCPSSHDFRHFSNLGLILQIEGLLPQFHEIWPTMMHYPWLVNPLGNYT